MNKELGRKITSLTLMTIMLTWTAAMALPMVTPEAEAANQFLWVSVEGGAHNDNMFSGGQVVEIVVSDPAISELDTNYGMPDVTIDGKKVIMAQGVDGSWYAYVADAVYSSQIDYIYSSGSVSFDKSDLSAGGIGADFGKICGPQTDLYYKQGGDNSTGTLRATESQGVWLPYIMNGTINQWGGNPSGTANKELQGTYSDGDTTASGYSLTEHSDGSEGIGAQGSATAATTDSITNCATSAEGMRAGAGADGVNGTDNRLNGVVREPRELSNGTTTANYGNINLCPNCWPLIQTYDFTVDMNHVFTYETGGADETVTLTYAEPDGTAVFDRSSQTYGLLHEIGITIHDWELNIDPTDEDSWTFGSNPDNQTANYQSFDENGAVVAGSTANTNLDVANDGDAMSGKWGQSDSTMAINMDTQGTGTNVVAFQDNADTQLVSCTSGVAGGKCGTANLNTASQAVTFTETGANTGTFVNWDEGLTTNMYIASSAARGTTATFTWNDSDYSILHMPAFAEVKYHPDTVGDEWNSGEEVYVTLDDMDMNFDDRSEDAMNTYSNQTVVPAIKIGSPITSAGIESVYWTGETDVGGATDGAMTKVGSGMDGTQCSSNYAVGTNASYNNCYEKYSERSIVLAQNAIDITNQDALVFTWNSGTTLQTLKDLIGGANGTAAFTYINYDFRSFNGNSNNGSVNVNFTIYDGPPTNADNRLGCAPTGGSGEDCSDELTLAAGDSGNKGARFGSGLQGLALINGVVPEVFTDASRVIGSNGHDARFDDTWGALTMANPLVIMANFTHTTASTASTANVLTGMAADTSYPFALDIINFGSSNDGVLQSDRHHNAIYRLELEETALDSGVFEGGVEYIMLNQLNVNQTSTYNGTSTFDDGVTIIVHQDSTDEDEIRINYLDFGADGVETQVADQLAAPTHSGVVEFDSDSYKEADTVTITLTDMDLNVDSEVIDIFTVVTTTGTVGNDAYDQVGTAGYGQNTEGDNFGRLLDVTFDDTIWLAAAQHSENGNTDCDALGSGDGSDGLAATGFTLVETGLATGVFTGDFQVPKKYCSGSSSTPATVLGTDMEVNYVDYRDASGEIIEVGDGAGIRANTGSVSLDRTVYPVPFGTVGDQSTSTKGTPDGRSLFPIHATGITDSTLSADTETLGNGDLVIHIRVDDPDWDISGAGEDFINANVTSGTVAAGGDARGPLKIYVSRGSDAIVLATAGGDTANERFITTTNSVDKGNTREMGPIAETAPDSGVFELDFTVRYTDGPSSSDCPSKGSTWTATNGGTGSAETDRFLTAASTGNYCILQGDVITVEYSDPADAGGNSAVAYDSATFDLRNGVLQTDKSVYIIGSDIILTLIEPDLDLESDEAETWDLDLIEWDSDAATLAMGDQGGSASSFDPEPSDFRETGDSTGIFQIVIETPANLGGSALDRGELIELEYTDWGPSGANWVGEEYVDIGVDLYTSNFGATIELDQKVYTWTDKVYVTIVAPDHNFDSGLVDKIGDTDDDPLIVQTRSQKLTSYTLAETGTDTGIFSGEVILKGFSHDADGDPSTGTSGYDVTGVTTASGSGPTNGVIKAEDDDGLTVSYEYNEDEVVVGSALIRWNVGEVQWLESSYPAGGNGVVRIVDPDMNWDPENVDNFEVDVWSDSDAGGISLTVTETNEATGIFEGSVSFTTDDESSGHRLRAAEGDTITAEYEDNTLPDPYTRADDLDITGTAIIGTVVPPLERAPASNARVVDSFGNSLAEVSVDQQVQIEADLVNGQDNDQSFAYLVQVQDGNGVTVSLAWITGQLAAGQSFSPALSWIPDASGTYEATVFVWESVDNPTALSDTVSVSIRVV